MPRSNAQRPRGEAIDPSDDESTGMAVLERPGARGNQAKNWWKPGQSGNLSGRPKNPTPVTTGLRAIWGSTTLLGKEIPGGFTVGDLVIAGLVKGAAKGDARCLALITDRLDGKLTTQHTHTVDASRLSDAELMDRLQAVFVEITATEG